jgi:hypothetical protein
MPLVFYDPSPSKVGIAYSAKWTAQYVAADTQNRKSAAIAPTLGAEQVRNAIVQGLANVTNDREVIFAVGHGGALSLSEGTIELAPGHTFELARGWNPPIYVDPFYDFVFPSDPTGKSMKQTDQAVNPAGAARRLAHWAVYTSIGTAMRANKIYKVTFLTCRVGNALDFIKKISLDWNTLVKAYTRYVWYGPAVTGQRVVAYLDGDTPGSGTYVTLGETQLPQVDFVTVGPPLAQPSPASPAARH